MPRIPDTSRTTPGQILRAGPVRSAKARRGRFPVSPGKGMVLRQPGQGREAVDGSRYFSRVPSMAESGDQPHSIALSQYTIASWNSPRA